MGDPHGGPQTSPHKCRSTWTRRLFKGQPYKKSMWIGVLFGDRYRGGQNVPNVREGGELAPKVIVAKLGLLTPKFRIFCRNSVEKGQMSGPPKNQNFHPPSNSRRFDPPYPGPQVVGWSAGRHVDHPCGGQITPWPARKVTDNKSKRHTHTHTHTHTWCGVFTFQCFVFFLIFAFSCLRFPSFSLLLDFLKPKSGPSNVVIGLNIYVHTYMHTYIHFHSNFRHDGCFRDGSFYFKQI